MNIPLIVRPEAEEDIRDAFDWYESQTAGLGAEFLRCIEASFFIISRNPEMFAKSHRDIRRTLVRRFPYGVFFIFEKNRIAVLAVMHAKRHPRRWQNRS
jgi:plasmid stabilization system protein ParE